jgi:acyl-coenzyme A thioesterase PaaI-like protein
VTREPGRSPWPDQAAGEKWEQIYDFSTPRGGPHFGDLIAAQRLLQDRVAGASLPDEKAAAVRDRLRELAEELAPFQVPERERNDGWRIDLPGRGHPTLPPYFLDTPADQIDNRGQGRVTFTRFHLGGNGAVHGGVLPLLFDDVFGRVVNHSGHGLCRTASLKVNFRRITPIDTELYFDATVDSVEGRKRWVTGRLHDADGNLLSDAEALFLQLLPGQQ